MMLTTVYSPSRHGPQQRNQLLYKPLVAVPRTIQLCTLNYYPYFCTPF